MKPLLSLLLCFLLPALQAGPFFFGQQGAVANQSTSTVFDFADYFIPAPPLN